MKAWVVTTISQEIEFPAGLEKQDILNFLAERQSFRDAFVGLTDGDCTITNVEVLDDEVDSMDDE